MSSLDPCGLGQYFCISWASLSSWDASSSMFPFSRFERLRVIANGNKVRRLFLFLSQKHRKEEQHFPLHCFSWSGFQVKQNYICAIILFLPLFGHKLDYWGLRCKRVVSCGGRHQKYMSNLGHTMEACILFFQRWDVLPSSNRFRDARRFNGTKLLNALGFFKTCQGKNCCTEELGLGFSPQWRRPIHFEGFVPPVQKGWVSSSTHSFMDVWRTKFNIYQWTVTCSGTIEKLAASTCSCACARCTGLHSSFGNAARIPLYVISCTALNINKKISCFGNLLGYCQIQGQLHDCSCGYETFFFSKDLNSEISCRKKKTNKGKSNLTTDSDNCWCNWRQKEDFYSIVFLTVTT